MTVFGAGLVTACASGASGGDTGPSPVAADGPLEGLFIGTTISLEVEAGKAGSFFHTGIRCVKKGPDPEKPIVCSSQPPPPPETTADIEDGTFVIDLEGLAIQGTFVADGHVAGTWTYQAANCCAAEGDCCVTSGEWEAWHKTWRGGRGPPDAGPVSGAPDASSPGETAGGDVPGGEVPAEATPAQLDAVSRVNWYRAHVGLPPIDMLASINAACEAHAGYYATHLDAYKKNQVPGGVHSQSPDLDEGFTGVSFADRMKAAGYGGSPGWEIIAFYGNPTAAVDGWMETVYHRIPIVSPDAVHTGYGDGKAPAAIDVMDFGRKAFADKALVVVYPWPDQTGVPRSWSGNEGPQPPPPPKGYPSGPVITVTTSSGAPLTVDGHRLLDPAGGEVAHVWLPKGGSFLEATWAMYANAPLKANTRYTVSLDGKLAGQAWSREWSFTTGK